MRVLRNPVAQFLFLGAVLLVILLAAADRLAERAAEDEAVAEAEAINEVFARSVVRPEMPRELYRLDIGGVDQFDRLVKERLDINDPNMTRVIIWREDGTILYSDQFDLIGQRFRLTDLQQRVFDGRSPLDRTESEQAGDSPAETVGLPAGPQQKRVLAEQEQVRIYTRMRDPASGELILFEGDYALGTVGIGTRQAAIYGSFRWLVLGAPALLLLLVTPLLHILTRRLTKAGEERERLLRSAIDASDAERRRIARDLHDGVVQDLAGTAYSVTALARAPDTSSDARATLDSASESLRGSLSALRSLLAEIHPPDLHANGLGPALADLTAPAEREGVQASVSVSGVEHADDSSVALVWRVAQEAVRNTLRHAQASTLAVTVRVNDGTLCLEVVDDGVGFDPTEPPPPERYGLRGLRTLVADVGGRLEVESAPGEGTTVRVEVEAR